jgi:hypothetical protein
VTTATEASPLAGVSFALDGETFTCQGRWSQLRFSDLVRRARDAAGGDPLAQLVIVAETFLMLLGPDEYDRFAHHVAGHGTTEQTVTAIVEHLNEQIVRRLNGRRPR